MMYATMLPSWSRPPEPIENRPVPTKSARVLFAFGEHGPGGTTLHLITCASWLCQLKRIVLPSRWMCSHSLPVGPPPVWSGLALPPNVFCLWLLFPLSSFRQPPPVRRQRPGAGQPLIGVVYEFCAEAGASAQFAVTDTLFVHERFVAWQAGAGSVTTVASNVIVSTCPGAIVPRCHTTLPVLPTPGSENVAGVALPWYVTSLHSWSVTTTLSNPTAFDGF